MENGHHLQRVQSADGRKARDHLIQAAETLGYEMRCSEKSYVPHIQFRAKPGQRPYPFSLSLNAVVPTFYVRRPSSEQKRTLLQKYEGAHMAQDVEVKIPVPDMKTAKRISDDLL